MSTNEGIQGSGLTACLKRIGSMHVVDDGVRAIESHDGVVIARQVHPEFVHLFAAAPDLLALVNRAISVLQRHAPPGGLSDADALAELYSILDGPEQRAAFSKVEGK